MRAVFFALYSVGQLIPVSSELSIRPAQKWVVGFQFRYMRLMGLTSVFINN